MTGWRIQFRAEARDCFLLPMVRNLKMKCKGMLEVNNWRMREVLRCSEGKCGAHPVGKLEISLKTQL